MSHDALVAAVRSLLRDASQPPTLLHAGPSACTLTIVPASALSWLESALSADERDPPPVVTVQPGMKFGQPTLNGTRLTVEAVGDCVWAGWPLAQLQRDGWSELRLSDVLVCCWYLGRYGGRRWKKRWDAWARAVEPVLWEHSRIDYTAVAWPPTAKGEQG